MKDAMTFVVPSERDGGKAQRPDAVVDFFERDVFSGERGGDKQRRAVPGYAAIAAHQPHFHVPRIVQGRQSGRHRSWRGRIATRRRVILQPFVGALLLVFPTEATELLLVARAI